MNPYEFCVRVLSCVLVWYPTSTVASTVARFRDYLIWDLASNLVAELHRWFCCHWVSLSCPSSAIGFAGCLIGSCFGVPAQAYLGSQLLGSTPQEVALGNWMPRLLWMRKYYMQLCKACQVRQKGVEDFLHINMIKYVYIYMCVYVYMHMICRCQRVSSLPPMTAASPRCIRIKIYLFVFFLGRWPTVHEVGQVYALPAQQ